MDPLGWLVRFMFADVVGPGERHPSPARPALKGLDIYRDMLLAGWRGEVGLKGRRGGRRKTLPSTGFCGS
jgi:hypothetical protein